MRLLRMISSDGCKDRFESYYGLTTRLNCLSILDFVAQVYFFFSLLVQEKVLK